MPVSVDGHNTMLNGLRTAATHVALQKTTTLTAAAAAGATTATLSRTVAVNDYLSFNNGTNREVRKVTAMSGNTATFSPALGFAYAVNSSVGHAPKLAAGIVEPTGGTYARQAMSWSTASAENLTVNPAALPKFNVAGGNEIGGFSIWTAVTAGTFLGSFLSNNIEGFGAAGTYELTDADVNLYS